MNKISLLFFVLLTVLIDVSCIRNVDLIVQSHCDPGWIDTTDMYFDKYVLPIIDRNIDYLRDHPDTKYNMVETCFLDMWWKQASETRRNKLIDLVRNSQFAIQEGGWVMVDHGCPTYGAVIDSLTVGHSWLKEHLDYTPVEGFSLDPFGQSPTMAYLFSLAGFKYTTQWRISYAEEQEYQTTQGLEFWWQDDNDLAPPLFTHILNLQGYHAPTGFNFWWWWGNDPKITNDNIGQRAKQLVDVLDGQSGRFLSEKNLLVMWGGDFAVTHPEWLYGNTSLLIEYINNHEQFSKKYHLRYSTSKDYFDSVSNELQTKVPTRKNKDFMNYDDHSYGYWTGYYTSQPRIKLKAREGEREARVGEMIYSTAYVLGETNGYPFFEDGLEMDSMFDHLDLLRQKNALINHHDAITGTERWHVSENYILELDHAIGLVNEVDRTLLSRIFCESCCDPRNRWTLFLPSLVNSEVNYGDKVGFILYNSLGWHVEKEALSFPIGLGQNVREGHFEAKVWASQGGTKKEIELPTTIVSHDSVQRTATITFNSGIIPAVGYQYYILELIETKSISSQSTSIIPESITNGEYTIHFDPVTNKMSRITTPDDISMNLKLDFEYYESFPKSTKQQHRRWSNPGQKSGAYVFRPSDDKSFIITEKIQNPTFYDNNVFVEIRQQFSEYIDIGIRLYKSSSNGAKDYIEIVYYRLGVIPLDHEIIMSLESEIKNSQVLYHDELGFDIKKKVFVKKNVKGISTAANHYPMEYAAFIKDEDYRMTVLTTKSGSVSSTKNGRLEMMIHRSCSGDDDKGLFQPLIDKYVITEEDNFKMRISLMDESKNEVLDLFRYRNSYQMNFPPKLFPLMPMYWRNRRRPWAHMKPIIEKAKDFRASYSFVRDGMNEGGQDGMARVHLLSMNRISKKKKNDGIVLRFANLMDQNEIGAENEQIEPLKEIFVKEIFHAKEMNLTLLGKGNEISLEEVIELKPHQIRTFDVKFWISECNYILSTSENVCNGHGVCVEGECECYDNYSGQNCDEFDCFSLKFDHKAVCNSRGTCIGPNICECFEDYYGDECMVTKCPDGIKSDNPNVCTGHGKCENEVCICTPKYSGKICSESVICNGLTPHDIKVCHSRGKCIRKDFCVCDDSSFYGDDCEYQMVRGLCSGNGVYVVGDDSKCKCFHGYGGNVCQDYVVVPEKEKNKKSEETKEIENEQIEGIDDDNKYSFGNLIFVVLVVFCGCLCICCVFVFVVWIAKRRRDERGMFGDMKGAIRIPSNDYDDDDLDSDSLGSDIDGL